MSSPEAPPRPPSLVGRLLALGTTIALVIWVAVRIQDALKTKEAVEKARAEAAKAAASAGKQRGPLKMVRPEATTWVASVPLEGTLLPVREVDLAFKPQGILAEIRAHAGDFVKEGSVLASLDVSEISAQKKAAEAEVRAASVQLELAEDDAGRVRKMLEKGATSTVSRIRAQGQEALAHAQLERAQAQLRLLEVGIDGHILRAPFSGYVTRAPAAPGAMLSPGTIIYHLQDTAVLKLSGTVGALEADHLRLGSRVTFEFDGRTIEGKLTRVFPSLEAATRRVPVEAEFRAERPEAGQSTFRAGAFVRATISAPEPRPVLRLPAAALVPGTRTVVVVADGHLRVRPIAFTIGESGALLVQEGLDPEAAVVLEPPADVADGDPAPNLEPPKEAVR